MAIVSENLFPTVFISTEAKTKLIEKKIEAGIIEERKGNMNTKKKKKWKLASYVVRRNKSVKERHNLCVKDNHSTASNY